MIDLASIGIGVVISTVYMILGIGVARAVAKMKSTDISLFCVVFWPVVLGVVATTGDISD